MNIINTEAMKMQALPVDVTTWIATEMIPSILKKLSYEHKVSARAHLEQTISRLYEGSDKDTMKQKQMSLALDWLCGSNKNRLATYDGATLSNCPQLRAFCTISFMHWLYDKQKKVVVELFDVEKAEEIADTNDIDAIINKTEKEDMYTVIANYLNTDATDAERFIYETVLGLTEVVWSDEKRTTTANYPGGNVSLKTFYNHRAALLAKLKDLVALHVANKNTKVSND